MASTSKASTEWNSSDSESEREAKKIKFKNENRRENRPQKYRVEWESTPDFKGWLKPIKGNILNINYLIIKQTG